MFLLAHTVLPGQYVPYTPIPDTLVQEHFHTDPSPHMLLVPGGVESQWAIIDQDKVRHAEGLPGNWFWDIDLVDTLNNNCFTSASYLKNGQKNRNWLILPAVYIPDSSYWFCWRSQPFEAPAYMDGYQVLVSTTTNHPLSTTFTDTLFTAAETVDLPDEPSLTLSDFTFTRGYIHADGFTNKDYYFIEEGELGNGSVFQFYRCIFEPHTVSLAAYAGKKIFIAILHDAVQDNILQIDDIVVAKSKSSSTTQPGTVASFQLLSDGIQPVAYLTWTLTEPVAHRLFLTDLQGRVIANRHFEPSGQGIFHFDATHLPAGLYLATLQTADGQVATRKWVK
jgi:hypothetical protein